MSSRAVRKALKQRELEEAQARLLSLGTGDEKSKDDADDREEEDEADEELEEKQSVPVARGKPNLFAMLGGEDDEDEDEDEEPAESTPKAPTTPSISKSKKKKNKKKNKKKSPLDTLVPPEEEDEIDRALRQLNLKPSPSPVGTPKPQAGTSQSSRFDTDLLTLLKIDPKNLDASQEMRRLFGRAAVDTPDDGGGGGGGGAGTPRGVRRAAQRSGGGVVPGAAQGTRGMMMKKNIFAQAKPAWPNSGSGGLGMIAVKRDDQKEGGEEGVLDGCEFKFVHGSAYQDVQRQFMMCVMSMDPNRLIALLHNNPYHISTLLQVSEIFSSQQRDYTSSGDLLERALFTFGRSLHSTFSPLLTNPSFTSFPQQNLPFADLKSPRLSFKHFPNREFYLTLWRYIHNLTLRGTFRTASEFARMLFSLDPLHDPYAILLYLPILFLKAHQPNYVLALANSEILKSRTRNLPAVVYSLPLAYLQLGNDVAAREVCAKAVRKFPWVCSRLWQVCDLEGKKLPDILWGRVPPGEDNLEKIMMEMYVERARELWIVPEAAGLLMESAGTIYNLPPASTSTSKPRELDYGDYVIESIPANIARHVILSDIPAVTTLLPLGWKDMLTSSYDPLPPQWDKGAGYDMFSGVTGPEGPIDPVDQAIDGPQGISATMIELLRTLLPWIAPPPAVAHGAADSPAPGEPRDGEVGPGPPGRYEPDWQVIEQVFGVDTARRMREMVEERQRRMEVIGIAGEGGEPTGDEDEDEEGEGVRFLGQVARVLFDQERGEGEGWLGASNSPLEAAGGEGEDGGGGGGGGGLAGGE